MDINKKEPLNFDSFHHTSKKLATTRPIIPNRWSQQDYLAQTHPKIWTKFWNQMHKNRQSVTDYLQPFHLFRLGSLSHQPRYQQTGDCPLCQRTNSNSVIHHLFYCPITTSQWTSSPSLALNPTQWIANPNLSPTHYKTINNYINHVMIYLDRRHC